MIKNLISMNEKEWLDEENKTIHLFINKSLRRSYFTSMFNKEEIQIKFKEKIYLCRVLWINNDNVIYENGDLLIEIEFEIIKEID